ncbi:MAG TPA: metallophosphoesterase family protein [Tepidisphaeraceae bacterium]|jgi:putative phosphoesterase|nr:metallophosphoesterase family protein [Tepidisphaeraceae bacterium]
MLVGLLSDTHDRLNAMIAGMNALQQAAAEIFIHCGDVGSEQIFDQLAGTNSIFVWGNNDWDRTDLARYAQALSIRNGDTFAEVPLDGKLAAVTHGDDAKIIRRVLEGQKHDYLFLGHSHVRADHHVGKVRVINPGALHRANPKSVALLDTATDIVRFITVIPSGSGT